MRDVPLHGRNIHVQKYLMCLENCKGRLRIMYLIQIFFSDLGTSMCQWENEKSVIPLRESQNLDSCWISRNSKKCIPSKFLPHWFFLKIPQIHYFDSLESTRVTNFWYVKLSHILTLQRKYHKNYYTLKFDLVQTYIALFHLDTCSKSYSTLTADSDFVGSDSLQGFWKIMKLFHNDFCWIF